MLPTARSGPATWGSGLLVLLAWAALSARAPQSPANPAPTVDPPFVAGDGHGWNPELLGHHRAEVVVSGPAPAVHVRLPWRRPDADPASRSLVVTDAQATRIRNVRRGEITREHGEIWFEPASGAGRYFVYYLPFKTAGRSNYPTVTYPPFEETADASWLAGLSAGGAPEARVERFESIDAFNAFAPMQVIATAAETARMLRAHPGRRLLVFPEDREHAIRMTGDLPKRWIESGPTTTFTAGARRGEYLAFQLGVFAVDDVSGLRVGFTSLTGPAGTIAASRLSCLNTDGTALDGTRISRAIDVARGTVQAVWCGIDVSEATRPGRYVGTASVTTKETAPVVVRLAIDVSSVVVPDGGADEPWLQTRLRWLDSTVAQQNDVVAPYSPIFVRGRTLSILGRDVTIGPTGLPSRIRSYFTPGMTALGTTPLDVLAAPMALVVEDARGATLPWRGASVRLTERSPGTVRWRSAATAGAIQMRVEGSLEFDGYVKCSVALTAAHDVDLRDVRLEIPYARGAATYMMGLGQRGGRRPASLAWQWDVARKNQDGAWIGAVNGGLYYSLRDERYVRPLNTNFYRLGPLTLPASWGNDGKGGISIAESGSRVVVSNTSGTRTLKAGVTRRFDVVFLVTPFHPLETDFQWATRFYHKYAEPSAIRATGATIANIHHATPINPWINYPFIAHREMKAYVDEAHRLGLKVKIYDTVREVSNRAWEIFPLRSLGREVFTPGPGGGAPWLQEHLGGDYIAGWYVPENGDAALLNGGASRWHNYYVEGLRWLVDRVGIDGIYVDDVAYDRTTMKRVKRVLTAGGHPGIIDLHSANQFNERDGFINSAVLYLEHFPYVNRLWFGEYFDYEGTSPDFWLTEVSGVPFGLMGEMLEGGGNPWRGMVYGMTNRLPWRDDNDPRALWTAWDAFGMAGTRMSGYWDPACPARTSRPDVLATVYRKRGAAMIALASWADADADVTLAIDWRALGLDPAHVTIQAPAIARFQEAKTFAPGDAIPVAKDRGWLLVIRQAD